MDAYIGDIRLFAGNYAPRGWLLCNGAMLNTNEYDMLFTLIGTAYGGDGQNTFALPDLRGRVPVGQGAGRGLTPRVLSQMYGSENVTLLTAQLPQHSHTLNATTATATSAKPQGMLLAQTGADNLYGPLPASGPLPQTMAANTVSATGGNQAHANIMPSMAMNYIIAFVGAFPARN
ncbi:MAG: tail fiber protein [Gammaproteobacteria bacterium]|nr:tail fiber protein [Gammaproteobacteria bacterium]MBU0891858.1 tail fiber protein [Gammaproteobacteria bacterium]MBU1819510.1 tail fiber protein [Gammaproteobacteria bacterium]